MSLLFTLKSDLLLHILIEFSKKTIQILFLKITMTSVGLIDILIRNLKHLESLEVILYALRTRKYSMPSPHTGIKYSLGSQMYQ